MKYGNTQQYRMLNEWYEEIIRSLGLDSSTISVPPLYSIGVRLGCDPEFFLKNKKTIVESINIIPPEGLELGVYGGTPPGKIIRDGLQVELNPLPKGCREQIAVEVAISLDALHHKLIKDNSGVSLSFNGVISLSEKEMKNLHDESKKFGCAPSNNIYTKEQSKITVNPENYSYRSAGGHIHLGHCDSELMRDVFNKNTEIVIELLDIICGNTCVLVDRDPMQQERRKVYGKAGEYRLPPHGIEYRTLSNFWLNNYQLFGLAFGLARQAVEVAANIHLYEYQLKTKSPYRIILESINRDDIISAINNNDYKLAKRNFDKIKKYLVEMSASNTDRYPLSKMNIEAFEYFAEKINDYGLKYWFKESPLTYWSRLKNYGVRNEIYETFGWEAFSVDNVKERMIHENLSFGDKLSRLIQPF
jgi:hypothetical protein